MTAAAEAGMMTDREAGAVTLARETAAQRAEIGALTGAVAECADDALAGGLAPTPVLHWLIDANRLIAAAAQGQAATL